MMMNKRISTRLLEQVNGHVINPAPGTMVDTGIIEQDGGSS